MVDKLVIGEVLKPQGILGALKVKPYVDDVNRFSALKRVFIGGREYKVVKTTIAADAVIVMLSGVADRNAAELFRGKFLEVEREDAAPLEEGRFYVVDVLGCDVVSEKGETFGKVTDIQSKSYADIYTLRAPDGREIMFPLLKDVLVKIDVEKGVVIVDGKRFSEVAVYEN